MRTLLLLRGSAGCGKSTWIEENGLKPYTLSADDLRLLCQSPMLNKDGNYEVSMSNDNFVWKTLFQILEKRMEHGDFTVIDATNSKTSEMNRYKELATTYRYHIYCVDFTDIPIEEVKRRNANRLPIYKRVPNEVIDKMYSRFATQPIPSGITVIKPNELDTIWFKPIDLSEYKKIHHIGDIHGCNTALQEYLNGELKDDEYYIFLGDYTDRGIENVDVIKFLISIKDKPNVCFLEGNHERWLWLWANNIKTNSEIFEKYTKIELEQAEIDKKEVRKFYRKLRQCAYYEYNGKKVFVSHGGISNTPFNFTTMATEQMIKGIGRYSDCQTIAQTWVDNTLDYYYQIHAHRNPMGLDVQVNDRVFNLEGAVEFGGYLRAVQLNEKGFYTFKIQNTVYKTIVNTETEKVVSKEIVESDIKSIVEIMRQNKFVQEKNFAHISSFNFTRQAFYDKVWNGITVKARGLYVNTEEYEIVARAYDKFFNINEREEVKLSVLQQTLKFPVNVYKKENGFLGLVGYDSKYDDIFITTKSAPDGIYTEWFKRIFYKTVDSIVNVDKIREYVKNNKATLVFEVIDVENDPHIIEYKENQIILLDVVKNNLAFEKINYDELKHVANTLGFKYKELSYTLGSWGEFYDWYTEVTSENYQYDGEDIEGFVIEDSEGFMAKVKLYYYNTWKLLRGIAHETLKKGHSLKTSVLTTPLQNLFYGWLKNKHKERETILKQDIVSLRKLFYEEGYKNTKNM